MKFLIVLLMATTFNLAARAQGTEATGGGAAVEESTHAPSAPEKAHSKHKAAKKAGAKKAKKKK